MPELAEVEIARRNLAQWSTGSSIEKISLSEKVRGEGPLGELRGSKLIRWRRHGKLLMAETDRSRVLLCHLGMTGKWVADAPIERPHQHLVLRLAEGTVEKLSFIDPRRFGFVSLIRESELASHPRRKNLGPDPLNDSVDGAQLERIHGSSRAAVWRRLLDQSHVAGIGNIMAVDACYHASVHPELPCNRISTNQWADIWEGIQLHINRVLENDMGPEIDYLSAGRPSYFRCYGREGEPCHRCQTPLSKASLANRPIYFCGSCQTP